ILIGRDPMKSNLLVAIVENGKSFPLGALGSVPHSVSRCMPNEGRAHARIEVGESGNMTIRSLNQNNSIYVNGVETNIKEIDRGSRIELGMDRYRVNLKEILEGASKLVPSLPKDISHLKEVWDKYEAEQDRIVLAQQELAKKRMQPIMVSSASGIVSGIAACVELSTLWLTLPVTAIVSYLYYRNYNSKDTSHEDRKSATNEFQRSYVCPSCGHFLGNLPYDVLKNNLTNPKDHKMYCSTCRCELIEK
ncbi:MAG: FHA domain-containing protein, partial [Muribaculaceae bacterium]|nr:FHA domain-containing protein [Muribaculaceae bacterium]